MEQHAEEEEHGDDHGDDHAIMGTITTIMGTITMIMVMNMPRWPTTFTNDSSELRVVLNLDTASLNQSLVLNLVDEDTAIVGDEAFMNPVDSSEPRSVTTCPKISMLLNSTLEPNRQRGTERVDYHAP